MPVVLVKIPPTPDGGPVHSTESDIQDMSPLAVAGPSAVVMIPDAVDQLDAAPLSKKDTSGDDDNDDDDNAAEGVSPEEAERLLLAAVQLKEEGNAHFGQTDRKSVV